MYVCFVLFFSQSWGNCYGLLDLKQAINQSINPGTVWAGGISQAVTPVMLGSLAGTPVTCSHSLGPTIVAAKFDWLQPKEVIPSTSGSGWSKRYSFHFRVGVVQEVFLPLPGRGGPAPTNQQPWEPFPGLLRCLAFRQLCGALWQNGY